MNDFPRRCQGTEIMAISRPTSWTPCPMARVLHITRFTSLDETDKSPFATSPTTASISGLAGWDPRSQSPGFERMVVSRTALSRAGRAAGHNPLVGCHGFTETKNGVHVWKASHGGLCRWVAPALGPCPVSLRYGDHSLLVACQSCATPDGSAPSGDVNGWWIETYVRSFDLLAGTGRVLSLRPCVA